MDFYLRPAFLDPLPQLEISEEEYVALKRSRLVLNAAFSFEENYDLLVGNYLELESSALGFSAARMARRRHEYEDMFEITAEMNRRAVNFLSTARLFLDQLLQRVGTCGGDRTEVKRRLSSEYDNAFAYRFMEALRNHVQHSGSAIHGVTLGGEWQPPREKIKQVFSLSVFTKKRFLALDPSFKKAVLLECPDDVEFLSAARSYLGSLSDVHDFARSSIDMATKSARNSFAAAIAKYKEFSGESALGLAAFSSDAKAEEDEISIFLDWDNVRMKLADRNRNLKNLSKSVIASTLGKEYG
jgi:hypothetical protein